MIKTALLRILIGFAVLVEPVMAADFDGSKPFLCASVSFNECTREGACEAVSASSIKAPEFLRIDVKKKTIFGGSASEPDRPKTRITHSNVVDGKLFLQGVDGGVEGLHDSLAWNIALDQTSGRMVLSTSGDAVAFVIFGTCTVF